MPYFKCTQKVLDLLGIDTAPKVADDDRLTPGLGSWYVNCFSAKRRFNLLFMNERTCFSFLVVGLLKEDVLRIDEIFRCEFARALAYKGYQEQTIGKIMEEYATWTIARTSNRRLLGTMNDYAFLYDASRIHRLEEESHDAMIKRVNEAPMRVLDYRAASDVLRELWPVKNAPGKPGTVIQFDPALRSMFDSLREYYDEQIDWSPEITCAWVESFLLNRVAQGSTAAECSIIYDDIFGLIQYCERSDTKTPDKMPWWEFSVMLEWLDSHFLIPDRFDLTLRNARRILSTIRDFVTFLVEKKEIESTGQINQAYDWICGGKKLRLVTEIPYTGDEVWTELYPPGKDGIVFRMQDYWLVMLYIDHDKDWDRVRNSLSGAADHEKKEQLLDDLCARLASIGYDSPLRLLHGDVYKHEIEAAWRWLRGESQVAR